jgi:hypothetical protein
MKVALSNARFLLWGIRSYVSPKVRTAGPFVRCRNLYVAMQCKLTRIIVVNPCLFHAESSCGVLGYMMVPGQL